MANLSQFAKLASAAAGNVASPSVKKGSTLLTRPQQTGQRLNEYANAAASKVNRAPVKSGNTLVTKQAGFNQRKAEILASREARANGSSNFKKHTARERQLGVQKRERDKIAEWNRSDAQKGTLDITNKRTLKEVEKQKKLGTFVPEEGYGGYSQYQQGGGSSYQTSNNIKIGGAPADTKASPGQLMSELRYANQNAPKSSWKSASRLERSSLSTAGQSVEARKAALQERKASRRAEKPKTATTRADAPMTAQERADTLDSLNIETAGFFGASLETATKLGRSARSHFSEEGSVKRALIGTAQTSAISAAGHGGLAAIQGEDPWEAAKTGAIRGAFVGAGYQGLKGATGVNTGSIRGNVKEMYKTTAGVHKAHTAAGNAAARQNPDNVSHLVRKVMMSKSDKARDKNFFGLGGL